MMPKHIKEDSIFKIQGRQTEYINFRNICIDDKTKHKREETIIRKIKHQGKEVKSEIEG